MVLKLMNQRLDFIYHTPGKKKTNAGQEFTLKKKMLVVLISGEYHCIVKKKRHLKISTNMSINQAEIQKDYQHALLVKKDSVKFLVLVYISFFQTVLVTAAVILKGEVS